MIQAKPITRALSFAFGGLACAALISPALAQTTAQPERLDRVEITGSAIKRIEGESALPVTTITRQEIDQLGVSTAAELIDKLVANNGQGYTQALALGDSARPGFSGASLRGLGSNSTLILLNGRRLAVYAFDGGAVNLQQIPFAAIERIEVLRDGASAIYGTDAVAGVINFITRKDYTGVQAYASAAIPTASGGGETYSANILAGWGDLAKDRFNIFGVISYTDQNSLKAADRDFAKTALRPDLGINRLSSNAFPGNILTADGFVNPYAPAFSGAVPNVNADPKNGIYPSAGCKVPISYDNTSNSTRCRYDYASRIDIIPDNEVWSFLGRGAFQVNADNQIFGEATWAKQKSTFRISETPASGATTKKQPDGTQLSLLYPAGGPYYPGSGGVPAIPGTTLTGDLDIYYRSVELGPRTNQAETDEYRFLVGATGLFAGWDYNTAAYYTASKVTENYLGGYMLESKLLPAMYTGVINPFGENNAAGMAALRSTQITGPVRESELTQWTIDGTISKEIMKLPAGGMNLALGFQFYSQDYKDTPSPVLGSSDIIGGGGEQPVVTGSRDVYALFGELSIPIVKSLEAQVAVRWDHYSDFGNNVSPKVGLRWQPNSTWLVRGSYGQGFRAPTIPDMVSPPANTNSGNTYDDPFYDTQVGCATRFDPLYCNAQLSVTNSGNQNLKPEESDQWTLGVVFEPTREFSMGVDFWWINQKNLLAFPQGDNIIQDCIDTFNAAALNCTGTLAASERFRTANIPGFGAVKVMNTAFNQIQNYADQNTNGIDIEARLRLPPTSWGSWTFNYNGTYILDQQQKITYVPGQDWVKTVGSFSIFGPVVQYKHLLSATWAMSAWTVTLNNNYQHSYDDENPDLNDNVRVVHAYSTFDLYARWTGVKNLAVVAGVNNLFNRQPPSSNQGQYFQVGYDPTYVNPRLRTPYINLTYKFF